jgi:hypothetical protein
MNCEITITLTSVILSERGAVREANAERSAKRRDAESKDPVTVAIL